MEIDFNLQQNYSSLLVNLSMSSSVNFENGENAFDVEKADWCLDLFNITCLTLYTITLDNGQ